MQHVQLGRATVHHIGHDNGSLFVHEGQYRLYQVWQGAETLILFLLLLF
jgi:hypothetical protein